MNRVPSVGIDWNAAPLELVDDLFLTVLARLPTSAEWLVFGNVLAATPEPPPASKIRRGKRDRGPVDSPRLRAARDIYWALVNSAEFAYNH